MLRSRNERPPSYPLISCFRHGFTLAVATSPTAKGALADARYLLMDPALPVLSPHSTCICTKAVLS